MSVVKRLFEFVWSVDAPNVNGTVGRTSADVLRVWTEGCSCPIATHLKSFGSQGCHLLVGVTNIKESDAVVASAGQGVDPVLGHVQGCHFTTQLYLVGGRIARSCVPTLETAVLEYE